MITPKVLQVRNSKDISQNMAVQLARAIVQALTRPGNLPDEDLQKVLRALRARIYDLEESNPPDQVQATQLYAILKRKAPGPSYKYFDIEGLGSPTLEFLKTLAQRFIPNHYPTLLQNNADLRQTMEGQRVPYRPAPKK